MPQADGSQKAIQVMIFSEQQRGTGEGHRPWDRPNSTMTNATVDTTVGSVDGQVVMVKYKDGEKKIVVGPDAVIRAYVVGSRDELKPGANVAIVAAAKQPDGTLHDQPHQCRPRRHRAVRHDPEKWSPALRKEQAKFKQTGKTALGSRSRGRTNGDRSARRSNARRAKRCRSPM